MVNAAELIDTLRRFHLLEEAQLTELSVQVEGQTAEPDSLARSLVKRNWLTPFQANHLLQGRGQELLLGSY